MGFKSVSKTEDVFYKYFKYVCNCAVNNFQGEIAILSTRLHNQNEMGASLFPALPFSFINKEFVLFFSSRKRRKAVQREEGLMQYCRDCMEGVPVLKLPWRRRRRSFTLCAWLCVELLTQSHTLPQSPVWPHGRLSLRKALPATWLSQPQTKMGEAKLAELNKSQPVTRGKGGGKSYFKLEEM